MRTKGFVTLLLTSVWVIGLGSCGTEDPTRVDRPPVVRSFSPSDQELDAFVGDTLTFEVLAIDPDETTLKQRFTLNDSVVSNQYKWDYVVADTGLALIQCIITDGANDSRIRWEVWQHDAVNLPPEIIAYAPVEQKPVLIIGHDLLFVVRARDPNEDPLNYRFTVNDSLVWSNTEYLFVATRTGEFDVKAIVSDGELSTSRTWDLTVTPQPDTVPPSEVPITVAETGEDPGEVNLEWSAVGADGMEGIASNYLVRTAPTPIVDEYSWSKASERPGVPAPLAPGERMSMVITGITPARFTHVAVRAMDNFGNISPLGESPGVYARGMKIAGIVRDALTGLPMPNVHVTLGPYDTTTTVDGEFELVELPPMITPLIVSEDNELGTVGTHYDIRIPYEVVHLDYKLVYLMPDYQLETAQYEDFFEFYVSMTTIGGSPFPNNQRRWEAPIDIYARPFVNEGLDYQATIHQNVIDMNTYLGMNAFNVTDEEPEVGVTCIYPSNLYNDNYGVSLWSSDWFPVKADIEFRRLYTPASAGYFQVVIRHELGHALGLNHSSDINHLMIGGQTPQVPNFSSDELAVLHVLYNIPRGVAIGLYVRE
jgi:hypothetical protein